MDDSMLLDIENFDFNMIDDGDDAASVVPGDADYEEVFDEDESSINDEEFIDDEQEAEEKEEVSLMSFAENFSEIPDDLEFTIDGAKVTKADLTNTFKAKAEVEEAREGLNTYIKNLTATEAKVQDYIKLSVSETENRLKAVNNLLANPESMSPSDVQKALVAKRDLENRYRALETNIAGLRQAEAERKEQVSIAKIRQADVSLRGTPGYAGMSTIREVATFAEANGISSEILMEGMSPGLIKLLMDAKTYRDKVGSSKDRIKSAAVKTKGTANRSVSSKPKATTGAKPRMKSEVAFQRFAKGEMAAADVFQFIKD